MEEDEVAIAGAAGSPEARVVAGVAAMAGRARTSQSKVAGVEKKGKKANT